MVFKHTDSSFAGTLGDRAQTAYTYGLEHPGVCQTAPCRTPYYYEKDNWTDDMELAAVQLALATGEEDLLSAALTIAEQEKVVPWMDGGRIGHYQWHPFLNLGHVGLTRCNNLTIRRQTVEFLRHGVERVALRTRTSPFRIGVPFI